MDKIKSVFGKVISFVKKNPKEFLALGVFVVALSIYLITNAFAALTPTKSVITSYEEKQPGSWQVEKSGKWISKGRARVTFDVDTTLMTEDRDTDIIMVLDISGSMSGDKLDRVKSDSTELIESLLSNKNNNAALITFDTGSTIVSDFTNDKDYLINEINNLEDTGSTNYYQPLVNVDNILKDYVKSDDKEVIVLFLTDGYPNVDTPNQIAQYETLKKTYPYITINGIQYEMGDTILNPIKEISTILNPIKEISDNQFHADMETLNNVLFDASVAPIPYDEFKIVDYIDNRYFRLNSEDDITVSEGSVKLEEENGKQKITWTIPYLKSGRDAKLSMDIVLKDEYIGQGGIYPTNESEEIISKIDNNPNEDVTSTKTPVLSDNYKVIYDGNAPDGSSVSNVPSSTNYSVFDTVSISTEEPSCVGYEFKGWEITNKDVIRVNDDHFIMPGEDVVIRAKWSKVEVAKSMDGVVNTMGDPIMKRYTSITTTDYHNRKYKSKVTSIVTKDDLEIPSTAIEYWDVSEAGDGSVIAYIEDDESGNETYKVTIGGQGGVIANPDSSYLFYGFTNLENINLTYLDTSRVTDMSYMFYNCESLIGLDLSNFDTSKVMNMSYMFYHCESLTSLYVGNFDTSKVTDMSYMFSYTGLSFLDVSNFDTSNVVNMAHMFGIIAINTSLNYTEIIGLENFDTSNVEDMSWMFAGCYKLRNIDVSNFDTSNVINMSSMFRKCSALTEIDVSNFDTSNVTDVSGMFAGYYYNDSMDNLKKIIFGKKWITSKVTNMSSMFEGCSGLTELDIVSTFNTSNVTSMNSMFEGCSGLTDLDVSNFDTSNVTGMRSMFDGCGGLTLLNVSNFDTTKVVSMSSMFHNCISLTSLDVSNFDTTDVTNMSSMFHNCSSLTSLDVSNFDTTDVTNMSSMFHNCSSLISLDVSHFDTTKVTDMSYMFSGCGRLTSLNVSHFDTLNVTDMSGMFSSCRSLTSLYLSFFDTSNVTSMRSMFSGCSGLTSLDVSNFDTSNVTSMGSMFSGCGHLTSLDVSNFDTSNVTSMSSMFNECRGLTSLDVSNFDTAKVTYMSYMFSGCRGLTSLDLSNFDTSNVTSMSYMFNVCSSLTNLDMRNADFSFVNSYKNMFSSVNININVIVKDSTAQSFIRARLDDADRTNATVTIANVVSQTSLFEIGPREFGPFVLL